MSIVMGLRLITSSQPATVVPLHPVEAETEQTHKPSPEPRRLYERIWRPDRPLAHGYLCVEEPEEAQIAEWDKQIASCCTNFGYRLGSIFIDRSVSTGTSVRSGFIELLAALGVPGTCAAVVPSLAHLSTDSLLQQTLLHMVQLTGSQLLITNIANGSSPEVAPSVGPRGEP